MNEPRRWLDDPDAPEELRDALRYAPRGRALDATTRARLGRRVARYAAIPLSAAAWLSVKSAAALGVAAGVATAGVAAVVERTVLAPAAPPVAQVASQQKPVAPKRKAVTTLAEPNVPPAPGAEAPPPVEPPRAPPSSVPSAFAQAPLGLAEESRLLERARRALASAPASALELTREHTQRFPKAQLAAERNLIEIEALYRTGHRERARARAERLLAQSSDDLYGERVRRLLAKIERGE
jgi:hypothetical protein